MHIYIYTHIYNIYIHTNIYILITLPPNTDLLDVSTELDRMTLLLGSDGLWDLWVYEEAHAYAMRSPERLPGTARGEALLAPLAELVEATRKQGQG